MSFTLGLNGRSYYNNLSTYTVNPGTGTEDTPDWDPISNQQDVSLTLNAGESDVTVRGGGGWAMYASALFDAEFSWSMIYDNSENSYKRIRLDFLARTVIQLIFMDGDITVTGTYEGVKAWCVIRDFSRNEELSEAMKSDIVARPSYYVNTGTGLIVAPNWESITTP